MSLLCQELQKVAQDQFRTANPLQPGGLGDCGESSSARRLGREDVLGRLRPAQLGALAHLRREAIKRSSEAIHMSSEAIKRSSEVLRGNQDVIRGNQEVLRGPQRQSRCHQRQSRGHQRSSEAIKRSSEAIKRSSEVLRGNQEVLRGHQRPSRRSGPSRTLTGFGFGRAEK